MKEASLVLHDQLSREFSIIKNAKTIVMIEPVDWAESLPHHKKKIVLHFSAMRHFSDELVSSGTKVIYYPMCEDALVAFQDIKTKDGIELLHVMEPSNYGVKEHISHLCQKAGIKVAFHPSEQFLYTDEAFDFKKPPLMETFYRFMRKKTGILMHGGKPLGGAWNFDKENRQKAPDDIKIPPHKRFTPDLITEKVIKEVGARFKDHFGNLDDFFWPVTRKDALKMLDDFIEHKLKLFGPYQDAMMTGQNVLFHSLLSPMLNINLIRPLEVVLKAQEAYQHKKATLESTEGFIRQIIGWREFVHQVYKANMPQYKKHNFFHFKTPLPDFYWDANTKMHCIKESVKPVIEDGINHHIQRLMVTGNFAVLAEIDPSEVNDWYQFAYMDGLDWVTTPNVLGLSLYADGGMIATKPYVSSAGYIQKMSNYCKSCPYNPKTAVEEDSCPFNSLYWHFIDKHKEKFESNPRMAMMVQLWNKRNKTDKINILEKASSIIKKIKNKVVI